MIAVVPLHEHYSPEHLDHVIGEMRRRGPPRIRAHYDDASDRWYALEGTHRLRAAMMLGVAPVLVDTRWPKGRRGLENARHRAYAYTYPAVVRA